MPTLRNSIGITQYTKYDAADRLTSVTDPHGFVVAYAYDEAGNLKELTYPGGMKVTYTYDELNRLKTASIEWLGQTATYNYKAQEADLLDNFRHFNGIVTSYAYDNAHRLTGLSSSVASYEFVTLDDNGNRTDVRQTEPLGPVLPASNVACTYNEKKNRLMAAGPASFSYDDEGQLSSAYGSNYSFDYAHRLVGIGASAQFRYDGNGNRLKAVRNGVTTYYIYDAAGNLLAEADGNKVITRYYIYGAGLLAMVTPAGQVYCYHYNATGSTVAMTDTSQTMVNKYAYDPFGNVANQVEAIPQPFKFVGQFGVMTEPNGFYYMRARYYDPSVGRFVSEDPLGFDGGDVNVYAYVGNNPVMFSDPCGLWTFSLEVCGSVFSGVGGGGGTSVNIGHSEKDGWSFSLTGNAQGGAIAGAGGFIGGGVVVTNADHVNQLNGTSYQGGRSGLGPIAVEGVKGSGYSGVSVMGGLGTGYSANSVTTSTTSAMIQYQNGIVSVGNTGTASIWSSSRCGK